MNTSDIIRVLVVDDDEDDFFMLKGLLAEIPDKRFLIDWAPNYEAGKQALEKKVHDVCFIDYRLGIRTGLDLLREAVQLGIKTPLILLTGYGERDVDIDSMRIGAADYLVKDQISPLLIERSIRYSIHRAQALQSILDRETQILLQDRLASLGLLASSLAHEIGTPLGVIRGRAEYLEMQLQNNPAIKKNVDVIIAQIDRVSKLIHSLLNLARGDQIKHAESIFLSSVIRDVLDLLAYELRKNEIELMNELSQEQMISVKAEAGPLHQVFLNLLVNALHAIDSAKKTGRISGHFIRIFSQDQGDFLSVAFEDTGCGISEANKKKLFSPFFTTKEIGVGTGLGLATSYRIAESWGGRIRAESVEGKGSVFYVDLPKGH